MTTRVISGVIITAATVILLLIGGIPLISVLFVVSIFAYDEVAVACGVYKDSLHKRKDSALQQQNEDTENKDIKLIVITDLVGITLYYLIVYCMPYESRASFVILLFTCMFMFTMMVYVIRFPKITWQQVSSTFFAFFYGPVMISFIYSTWEDFPKGKYIAALIFISAWISDTSAYFTGTFLGKHKLAPVLSPKKSVEGSIGGIIGSALFGLIYSYILYMLGIMPLWVLPVFAFISGAGSIIGQIGDLAASAIKRQCEIKDYGWIIPGHGGVMDRFDSVIATAPVIYYLARFMLMGKL